MDHSDNVRVYTHWDASNVFAIVLDWERSSGFQFWRTTFRAFGYPGFQWETLETTGIVVGYFTHQGSQRLVADPTCEIRFGTYDRIPANSCEP